MRPKKPNKDQTPDTGRRLARDLKIGDRFGTTKNGDAVNIKALHERCSQMFTPHVHVVTTVEVKCLAFDRPV